MNSSLDTYSRFFFSSWRYWNYSWCISRCCWCSILINTLNFNSRSFTCEVWFWGECYFSSFRINCVCSFVWYFHSCFICWLSCCWIYQFSWFCSINFDCFFFTINSCFTTCECWSCFLRCSLNIFSNFIVTFWCYWFNKWCIFTIYWSTIFIFTLNFNSFSFTSEVWFWGKGYFSIFINFVSSFTWYCYRFFFCWFTC